MKMLVCVLLTVTCWTAATAEETPTILTLTKVMNELRKLKDWTRGMDDNTTMINSPTVSDIKDCCIPSALECFRSKVIYLVNNKLIKSQRIISKELHKTFIVKSVSTCSPKETEEVQCKTCDSQPTVDRHTFVENFHTLLQKIFVRLQ